MTAMQILKRLFLFASAIVVLLTAMANDGGAGIASVIFAGILGAILFAIYLLLDYFIED